MPLDDKSEIIAHFIGIFDQSIEAARQRIDYDAFRARPTGENDPNGLLEVTVNVNSPYAMGDYAPGLDVQLPQFQEKEAIIPYAVRDLPPGAIIATLQLPDLLPFYGQPLPAIEPLATINTTFILPPPSSMASVIIQQNYLSDNDIIDNVDFGDVFVSPDRFQPALDELVRTADALQLADIPGRPGEEGTIAEIAKASATKLANAQAPQIEGATTFLAHGAGATASLVVNGQAQEDAPVLKDAMPAAFDPKPEPEMSPDPEVGALPDNSEPVHILSTGTNILLNEASITSFWLDTKVIVAVGDSVAFNAITQVNVRNEFDQNFGHNHDHSHDHGHGSHHGSDRDDDDQDDDGDDDDAYNQAQSPISISWNVASISSSGNATSRTDEDDDAAPSRIVVTRIEGNVILLNHIEQFNMVSDHDITSITFSGNESVITTGDNVVFNASFLYELGFQYDLIFIGGNMIDVSVIRQTNVLLDADNFMYGGGDDFDGMVNMAENMLWNSATIKEIGEDRREELEDDYKDAAKMLKQGAESLSNTVLSNEAFEGIDLLRVLYIAGDYVKWQTISQTNVLGDADQVAIMTQTLQSAEGANVQVATGSNALMNIASITDGGIDSTVYVGGDEYSDALLYQADFISTDNPLSYTGPTTLASEAVLFLADGMIKDGYDDDDDMDAHDLYETSVDVMETVLA